jgi:hypothetical protein
MMTVRIIALLLAAAALLVLALFLIVPVAVNWPDSWFGGLLSAGSMGSAVALAYKAVQLIRRQISASDKDRGQILH